MFADGKPPSLLDVGCGMGKFLIETAIHQPETNILGFEIRVNAVEWVNKVINGEKTRNAKVLWYSIVNEFPFIESSSVEKIFYLFPDPWIKKRHHKRRAFTSGLLDEFHRMLLPAGKLYIMTDVPDVDEHHCKVIEENKKFVYEYIKDPDWDVNIKTNQEEFCLSKNIPFTKMICYKFPKPEPGKERQK